MEEPLVKGFAVKQYLPNAQKRGLHKNSNVSVPATLFKCQACTGDREGLDHFYKLLMRELGLGGLGELGGVRADGFILGKFNGRVKARKFVA